MDTTEKTEPVAPWWGTSALDTHRGARWQIGPLTLWLERRVAEWRVAFEQNTDPIDQRLVLAEGYALDSEAESIPPETTITRFGARAEDATLTLTPGLADRAVVVKPEWPFWVLPDSEITFHVSTPVTVVVAVGEPPRTLAEVPSLRQSDTWFGPPTSAGELCFAGRTRARIQLENVLHVAHRAITTVRLLNNAAKPLQLQRFKLPAPNLALFGADTGRLWTSSLTVATREDEEVSVSADSGAPVAAANAVELAEPRRSREGVLARTFNALFG